MKSRSIALVVVLCSMLILMPMLSFAETSLVVDNCRGRFVTDSGHDGQGQYTIVDAFDKKPSGWKDVVWYGEYAYIKCDGGAWQDLPPGTLIDDSTPNSYTTQIVNPGGYIGVTVVKNVTIDQSPSPGPWPFVTINYTIAAAPSRENITLYYSIDFCDGGSGGNVIDDVYDNGQIMSSGWYTRRWLMIDTLGSGFGYIETVNDEDFYAGYWYNALYGPKRHGDPPNWPTGQNIDDRDDGIGVLINYGSVGATPTSRLLLVGVNNGCPAPQFPDPWITPTFYEKGQAEITISPPPIVKELENHTSVMKSMFGTLLTLNASSSFAPENCTIETYEWDLDGDGQYDDATGVVIEYTFPSIKKFNVGLKVTDNCTNSYTTSLPLNVVKPVGGIWVPVDKLGLLAPYIALASTILLATVATAIYVKHAKRRKKKQ